MVYHVSLSGKQLGKPGLVLPSASSSLKIGMGIPLSLQALRTYESHESWPLCCRDIGRLDSDAHIFSSAPSIHYPVCIYYLCVEYPWPYL